MPVGALVPRTTPERPNDPRTTPERPRTIPERTLNDRQTTPDDPPNDLQTTPNDPRTIPNDLRTTSERPPNDLPTIPERPPNEPLGSAAACGGLKKNWRGLWWLKQKKRVYFFVSQTIDLDETIKTVTKSSKSELSSRGKRPFKVSRFLGPPTRQKKNGPNKVCLK